MSAVTRRGRNERVLSDGALPPPRPPADGIDRCPRRSHLHPGAAAARVPAAGDGAGPRCPGRRPFSQRRLLGGDRSADRGAGDVPRPFRASGRSPGTHAVRRHRAGARRSLRDAHHRGAARARAHRLSSSGGSSDPAPGAVQVERHCRARRRRFLVHGSHQSRRRPAHRANTGDRVASRAHCRRGRVDRRPCPPPRGPVHPDRTHASTVSRSDRGDRPALLAGGPGRRVAPAHVGRIRRDTQSPHAGGPGELRLRPHAAGQAGPGAPSVDGRRHQLSHRAAGSPAARRRSERRPRRRDGVDAALRPDARAGGDGGGARRHHGRDRRSNSSARQGRLAGAHAGAARRRADTGAAARDAGRPLALCRVRHPDGRRPSLRRAHAQLVRHLRHGIGAAVAPARPLVLAALHWPPGHGRVCWDRWRCSSPPLPTPRCGCYAP